MDIYELSERKDLFEEAVNAFWKQWGSEESYHFYKDCMLRSCETDEEIPRFYIAVENGGVIGTFAILRNDINSRQDLTPWLACLYVDPEFRGKGLGSQFLQYALDETARKGFKKLYLATDIDGYYEKYQWKHTTEAFGLGGSSIKVYEKSTMN
ncbi:GNAT family N-acetyltransferase [Bacillus sp. Marseille-Q1617]|uniref:GNAT family N-acetyltransferase n=1 Tax=Bacillus sp. Marseille-Q1617 TaxID=2736887 RepID=UPI00158BA5A0|nr:GNAT family N-acetyltransferase [Bacillus sp. Marseille-Q1617]